MMTVLRMYIICGWVQGAIVYICTFFCSDQTWTWPMYVRTVLLGVSRPLLFHRIFEWSLLSISHIVRPKRADLACTDVPRVFDLLGRASQVSCLTSVLCVALLHATAGPSNYCGCLWVSKPPQIASLQLRDRHRKFATALLSKSHRLLATSTSIAVSPGTNRRTSCDTLDITLPAVLTHCLPQSS